MATNKLVAEAYAVSKDEAVDSINVTIDTSKWSKRKQNIIVRAIDTAVADCGWDTGVFVKALTNSYGIGTQRISKWNTSIDRALINPDKFVEVCAYIAAMVRMREGGPVSWDETNFLRSLDDGNTPPHVPLPKEFSREDRALFLRDYLKPQAEADKVIRTKLINDIRSGHKLTISYTI